MRPHLVYRGIRMAGRWTRPLTCCWERVVVRSHAAGAQALYLNRLSVVSGDATGMSRRVGPEWQRSKELCADERCRRRGVVRVDAHPTYNRPAINGFWATVSQRSHETNIAIEW